MISCYFTSKPLTLQTYFLTIQLQIYPVDKYTPHFNIICQWHKKKIPSRPQKAEEKKEEIEGGSQHTENLKNQKKEKIPLRSQKAEEKEEATAGCSQHTEDLNKQNKEDIRQ